MNSSTTNKTCAVCQNTGLLLCTIIYADGRKETLVSDCPHCNPPKPEVINVYPRTDS